MTIIADMFAQFNNQREIDYDSWYLLKRRSRDGLRFAIFPRRALFRARVKNSLAFLRGCVIIIYLEAYVQTRLRAGAVSQLVEKASQSFAPYGRERDCDHFRRRRVRRRKYFGFPMSANRTHWERRSSEMTELSALAGSEGYAACDDEASVELSTFGGQ